MLVPMMTPRRYVLAVFVLTIITSLYYLLSIVPEDGGLSIFYNFNQRLQHNVDLRLSAGNATSKQLTIPNPSDASEKLQPRKANATFVFLCRNNDLAGVVTSIQQMEDRFNRKYNYPWVLLNEEPFTDEFKKRVSILTHSSISFGIIPSEHWHQPNWIDEEKAKEGRQRLIAQRIIYAGSVSYRNMCRFNSGFFYHHELLKPYRYYWRVEPDVKYFCDLDYDPFLYMEDNDKLYGFTISLFEWQPTIPSLWDTVKEFTAKYPQYLIPQNSMSFLSDDGGNSYNLCHYWSNFEIADMDFWRGEAYGNFFNYLEATGGFYYERWGDAPVHSIAVSLFARRDQVHFFKDIGYRHESFQHCPQGKEWEDGRCVCDPNDNFDYAQNSCLRKYNNIFL